MSGPMDKDRDQVNKMIRELFASAVDRERVRPLSELMAQPPYPWCRDPKACAGKGYCTRDPNCGD